MGAKKREMPRFTKAPEALVTLFGEAVQSLPDVELKRMFGYPAAFASGNMFSCLFGDKMIVRLSEIDRAACAREFGAQLFEPMPGRPMREYVALPDPLLKSTRLLDVWLRKGRSYAASLPPKKGNAARPRTKKRATGSRGSSS
jgi:TfoX/Sxy family transcriptional regulator of competence genes